MLFRAFPCAVLSLRVWLLAQGLWRRRCLALSHGSLEQEHFLRSPPTQVGDGNSLWQHKSLSMVEKPLLIHCILLSV